jgi:capsular exopolysaccharide synthesis family protein
VVRNRGVGGNNNVLDLSYRSGTADDAGKVLDAVVESYRDFLDEKYRTLSDETLKLIIRARDLQAGDLKKEEENYRDFRLSTPLVWSGQDGSHVSQERLSGFGAKRASLLLRRADLLGELRALEKARTDGMDRANLLALAATFGGGDDARRALPDQLFSLLAEEQKLLERFGPEHPQVKSIRKRIEIARQFYSNPAAPFKQESDAAAKGGAAADDAVEMHFQYLRQQLNQVEGSEKLVNEMYEHEQDEIRKLTRYEIEDEMHRNAVKRAQQLYDGIVKSLQDVDLARDAGGYEATVIAPPGAGRKVAPNGLSILAVAGLLGLLGGCALASLAEGRDRSFHGPGEVRRLGLPVVGYIPRLTPPRGAACSARPGGPPLDPVLCTFFRPESIEAEAFRGVRTALLFGTHGEGHKVIQITSPNEGDGKTTLATNLAVSLCQSGRKVLLVDADLRRARAHRALGLPAGPGLASVIAGKTEPLEAILESGIPGLSLLPCGPLPPNPAELLTSPRFKELLDFLRERYDFILIDTPSLLAVTDPSVVAPRVDGVILTVRLTGNARPAAERAREILTTLGAKLLGVVVNGRDGRTGPPARSGYGYAGASPLDNTAAGPAPEGASAARVQANGGGRHPGAGFSAQDPLTE